MIERQVVAGRGLAGPARTSLKPTDHRAQAAPPKKVALAVHTASLAMQRRCLVKICMVSNRLPVLRSSGKMGVLWRTTIMSLRLT